MAEEKAKVELDKTRGALSVRCHGISVRIFEGISELQQKRGRNYIWIIGKKDTRGNCKPIGCIKVKPEDVEVTEVLK
jgi:hypothetical protein